MSDSDIPLTVTVLAVCNGVAVSGEPCIYGQTFCCLRQTLCEFKEPNVNQIRSPLPSFISGPGPRQPDPGAGRRALHGPEQPVRGGMALVVRAHRQEVRLRPQGLRRPQAVTGHGATGPLGKCLLSSYETRACRNSQVWQCLGFCSFS